MQNGTEEIEFELNDFALCKSCQNSQHENTLIEGLCYDCRNIISLEDEPTELLDPVTKAGKIIHIEEFDEIRNQSLKETIKRSLGLGKK